MTWLLKNMGDSDEWKEAGGGRSKKIWKAVHQLEQRSPLGRKEGCMMGRTTKGASTAPAKFPFKKLSETIVAKCQHVLNWSGGHKGGCYIPHASCC